MTRFRVTGDIEEQKGPIRKQSEMLDSDNLEFYQDIDDSDAEENSMGCKFAQYEQSSEQPPLSVVLKAMKVKQDEENIE
jgi:hypothetical protein